MTALVAVLAASATLAGLWPRRWSRAVMPGRPDVVGPAVAWPGRPVSLPTRPRVVRPRDPRPDTAEEPALCAELLAVAAAAGSSVAEAVVGVGRAPGTGAAMRACADSLERGTDLIDVLEDLGSREQPGWHSLATLLSLSATSGAPVAQPLRRFAIQERKRLRREREQRVRRLPVVLLLPLAGLVLPAFVPVTIAPLAMAGKDLLELPPTEPATGSQERSGDP